MKGKALEAALREGGEKVTQGRIRIDANRALQRLRDFRFADPAHWVLEVLRAAVLSHAKRVTVRTDADDVELDFDGEAFPPEAMAHLLEQALNPGTTDDERRTRLLALGVAGALGVGARFVTVRSGGVKLTLTAAGVEQAEAPGKGTSLHLRKAFGWRVASALLRGSPERAAVLERTPRFPLALVVDGKRVATGGAPVQPLHAQSLHGKGWRLEAAVPRGEPLARSTLELDVAGVRVATRDLELPGVQVQAWLRGDGLRRNASGSDVVDDDPQLQEALAALREASFTLLERRVRALEGDHEAWRHHFVSRLVALAPRAKKPAGGAESAHPEAKPERPREDEARLRELLSHARVLPGPAGEWHSPAEVELAAKGQGRLYVAAERHPAGSYPRPTVYLPPGSGLAVLLPKAKHVDVAALVQRRARIVERRAEVDALPVEPAQLPGEGWLAKAPLGAPGFSGEVGLVRGGHGAFVRVLAAGKLLEAGEVEGLAPLRLRAVVDLGAKVPDGFFDPLAAARVLGHVADAVEAAAARAIVERLPAAEVLPHARGLLARLVLTKEQGLEALPAALRAAPLFECLEGPPVSLERLAGEPSWPFTARTRGFGRLDGSRVLRLDAEGLAVLARLGKRRLEDVSKQLDHEVEVRRRLAGPTREPRLRDVLVETDVLGVGITGRAGIPRGAGTRLSLELLRRGIPFEETELTARFHHAAASVECAALEPNARWDGVKRDEVFGRVTAAVAEAERRLARALAEKPEAARTPGGRLYLLAFLKKELTPFAAGALGEVTGAFAAAPLFETVHGPRSLLELDDFVRRGEPLLWLPPGAPPGAVPPELPVLVEPDALVTALAEALRCGREAAGPRLARLAALGRLARQPLQPFSLPGDVALQLEVAHDALRVLAGLGPGVAPTATVRVSAGGRLVSTETVPCALPLEAVVEWPALVPAVDGGLAAEQREVLSTALSAAARAVTRLAAATPAEPHARRALLVALGRHLDGSCTKADADALLELPVFDCTDGERRSVLRLAPHAPPLRVVQRDLGGTLPDGKPIVRALDEETRVAMRRWGTVEHVDPLLEQQNAALAARARLAQVDAVTSAAPSPWRRRVEGVVARGEVLVSLEHAGRLELYLERRPLVVLEGALPGPLAAAVDAPCVTAKPGFTGVEDDAALRDVVAAVTEAAVALAGEVATAPGAPGVEAAKVSLAFWVAGLEAWRWRGQKKPRKGKGKKGKKRDAPAAVAEPAAHPLASLPLLRDVDERPRSVAELVARGRVEYALRGGGFVDPARVAWWPREGELAWAKTLGLDLHDVTKEVDFAAALRARPRVRPTVPRPGRWTKPVTGPHLTGEARLADEVSTRVVLEVLHEGVLVETFDEERSIGGFARVEGAHLVPNDDWTKVKRDGAFKALLAAVDAALAEALEARLGEHDATWRGWVRHAVQRFGKGQHTLAGVVAGLPLLVDLSGAPTSLGAVLAAAPARRVRVARAGTPPPADAGLVLRDDPETRALLGFVDVEWEDVTGELRRKQDLQQALSKRRLSTLAWRGLALVRHEVKTPGLGGELAISADGSAGLLLARDGIPVGPLEETWPGVVGVLDLADLAVDEEWKGFTVTRAQRAGIRAEVELLYGALAGRALELAAAQRGQALAYTLAWLGELGVEAPGHLERLDGAARALATAPWFDTLGGERVDLFAVAGEIAARQRVAVTADRALAAEAGETLVLHAEALDAPWLAALEERFGKTRLWRVPGVAAWRAARVEAEPLDGTPEALGLRLLRRELRLLRAGALGRLTPDDLEDVKLHRAGGALPVRYERKRKLALLDPEHPLIARTLAEAKQRPERLWVLLATLFGHVNRELDHVTDAHEAQLLLALAGHLAANPKLLAPPE